MAKQVKAIKCPHCGSIQKTAIGDHCYRCHSCQTEYFLDDDDININVNYRHQTPGPTAAPPTANKKVIAALSAGILVFVCIMLLFSVFSNRNARQPDGGLPDKPAYDYSSTEDFVFSNTATGEAVLLRLGREQIEDKERSNDFVHVHAVFIDPVSKKQLKDDILFSRVRRLDDHGITIDQRRDGNVYLKYAASKIVKLDRANNKLSEVTHTILRNHPAAASGIATIDFRGEYWVILTNDGQQVFYLPDSDQMVYEYSDIDAVTKNTAPPVTYDFDNQNQLVKITRLADKTETTLINPDRKYFKPELITGTQQDLVISVGVNASPDAAVSLQRIDAATGKVMWTSEPANYYLRQGTKCKQGYAIHYFSGEEMDYISGVLVFSPEGKLISDYLIKRNE